jgi:hypothetical protein
MLEIARANRGRGLPSGRSSHESLLPFVARFRRDGNGRSSGSRRASLDAICGAGFP